MALRSARAIGDDGATVLDKSLLDRRSGLLVVVAQQHHPVAQRLERCGAGIRSIRLPATAVDEDTPNAASNAFPWSGLYKSRPRSRPISLAPSHTTTEPARKALA